MFLKTKSILFVVSTVGYRCFYAKQDRFKRDFSSIFYRMIAFYLEKNLPKRP